MSFTKDVPLGDIFVVLSISLQCLGHTIDCVLILAPFYQRDTLIDARLLGGESARISLDVNALEQRDSIERYSRYPADVTPVLTAYYRSRSPVDVVAPVGKAYRCAASWW